MQRSSETSSIYDLGYQPYDGARLGRTYALQSLFFYSLRGIFGLGRSAWAKVFPFGLVAIAVLPSVIQIAIAAVVPAEFELVAAYSHFRYTQVVIALFCAVAAPEIIGRDQRARMLTLYFSRALSRVDYLAAKLGALCVALFLLTFVPQVLLFLGNAVATDAVLPYIRDNLSEVPPIVASCLAIAAVMGSVSLTIASQSQRRAISTIAVIGALIVSFTLSEILVHTLSGDGRGYALLLSPMQALDGLIFWIFGATADFDDTLSVAGLEGYVYLAGALAYVAVATGFMLRRFQRMAV